MSRESSQEEHASVYSRRFQAILEAFRRSDGDRWKGPEIERASGGSISSAYFYNLKNGRIKNPGHSQLEEIARVMGFSVVLWSLEPWDWEGNPRIDPRAREAPLASGDTLARRLNRLVRTLSDSASGANFSDAGIAERAGGGLTEGRVVRMRQGECHDPSSAELMALSELFEVSFSYWEGEDSPLLSEPVELGGVLESGAVAHRLGEPEERGVEKRLEAMEKRLEAVERLDIGQLLGRLSGPDEGDQGRRNS